MLGNLWDKFWSGGIANPLTAIEQISYLLFMRRLEEIDIIIDLGSTLVPIEIKSGATISKDFFNGLNYWQNLTGTKVKSRAALIYGGNNSVIRNKIYVYAWWNF